MELTHDFKISIPLPRLIQLFPMHPFSTPSKLRKPYGFLFSGGTQGAIGINGAAESYFKIRLN